MHGARTPPHRPGVQLASLRIRGEDEIVLLEFDTLDVQAARDRVYSALSDASADWADYVTIGARPRS